MKKTKFTIEYQLKTASQNVLWNSISTSLGLSEWFADGVVIKDKNYLFNWEDHTQTAVLIHSKPLNYVRFQWEEDFGSDYYFELKITNNDVTADLTILITDFAEANEKDDLIMLWNKQVEDLRRKTGI